MHYYKKKINQVVKMQVIIGVYGIWMYVQSLIFGLCRHVGASDRGGSGASSVQLPHRNTQEPRDPYPGG